MNSIINQLKAEADRLEWDALYTMKGHFNAAMIWNLAHYSLGISAIVLGAVAGKQFVDDQNVIASGVASVSAALTAIITFLKPSEKAQPHHDAGVVFAGIKRKARMFQNLSVGIESDPKQLRDELMTLAESYQHQMAASPPVPRFAYLIARRGVRAGEHTYNESGEKK